MKKTETTIAVFDFIDQTQQLKGRTPSYREITQALGLSAVSGIHRHIHKLVRWRWIEKPKGKSLAIRIIREPRIVYVWDGRSGL